MHNENQIKLADFGFAVYTRGEKQQVVLGSPQYMAPEIVKREEYSLPVDIWALGIITIVLLTGKSPYKSKGDRNAMFNEIVHSVPNMYPSLLSDDALEFVDGCLQKDPSKRKTA